MDPRQTGARPLGRHPRIAVGELGPDAIALNPQTLEPGEDEIVLTTLRRVLSTKPLSS